MMNAYWLCFQTADKKTLNPDAHGTRHQPRDCLVKKCVGFNEVLWLDIERAAWFVWYECRAVTIRTFG